MRIEERLKVAVTSRLNCEKDVKNCSKDIYVEKPFKQIVQIFEGECGTINEMVFLTEKMSF